MKYLILSICTVLFTSVCVACTHNDTIISPTADNTSLIPEFDQVAAGRGYKIVYDINTGVMYTVSTGTYNNGNFSVLYNVDGTPLLYSEIGKSDVQ